ncbi:hypothetical protein O3M35_001110 [Rhynocoris fuscipes]|uniref:Uncharacterized protein n=1 Tax=Rhynocoris fuscipes TaxID=488301 RepID=A0AAW1DT88_9HEMI
MMDCEMKEWIVNTSLRKLFKWKIEGRQSLRKQVLVTNLLLGTGLPKFFLFGSSEYKASESDSPARFSNEATAANTAMENIEDDGENAGGETSVSGINEINPISSRIVHLSPTLSERRYVIDQLLETLMQDVIKRMYSRRPPWRNTSGVTALTPYKSIWHNTLHPH